MPNDREETTPQQVNTIYEKEEIPVRQTEGAQNVEVKRVKNPEVARVLADFREEQNKALEELEKKLELQVRTGTFESAPELTEEQLGNLEIVQKLMSEKKYRDRIVAISIPEAPGGFLYVARAPLKYDYREVYGDDSESDLMRSYRAVVMGPDGIAIFSYLPDYVLNKEQQWDRRTLLKAYRDAFYKQGKVNVGRHFYVEDRQFTATRALISYDYYGRNAYLKVIKGILENADLASKKTESKFVQDTLEKLV